MARAGSDEAASQLAAAQINGLFLGWSSLPSDFGVINTEGDELIPRRKSIYLVPSSADWRERGE